MQNFELTLTGGHPNSLGNTVAVVEFVLNNPARFEELFNCYFSADEVVRLRVSNAMKRICQANKKLILPYVDRFLDEISKINQPSTQWTLAQLFMLWEKDLTPFQKERAIVIMQENIAFNTDWIVLNMTMNTIGEWAKSDSKLKNWLKPHILRLSKDSRKSVASKALKTLKLLDL